VKLCRNGGGSGDMKFELGVSGPREGGPYRVCDGMTDAAKVHVLCGIQSEYRRRGFEDALHKSV